MRAKERRGEKDRGWGDSQPKSQTKSLPPNEGGLGE